MYFVQALNSKNEWWRYLATLGVVFFVYFFLGALPLTLVVTIKVLHNSTIDLNAFNETYDPAAIGIEQNTGLILFLIPAVLSFIALLIMMIYLHSRKIGGIASATGHIRWNRLLTGSLVWLILLIAVEVLFAYKNPENYIFHYDPARFIPLVFITVLIIPLQAWSEELLFRSYLMQGIGILFNSRIIALIITSCLFGSMHFMNPEVKEFGLWTTMPYYIGFGLFAGLLVVFDNGIELACGVHAINNMYSAALVTYNSSALKTAALWRIKRLDPIEMLIAFTIMAILYLIVMAGLYKWKNFSKLVKPVSSTN